MYFHGRKFLHFDNKCIELYSKHPTENKSLLIQWVNDDLVHCCICVVPGLGGLGILRAP